MTIQQAIAEAIRRALIEAREAGQLHFARMPAFVVERPPHKQLGDLSSNVALLLRSPATEESTPALSPREAAERLLPHLHLDDNLVDAVEVAGAGFLNFRLKPQWLWEVGRRALAEGDAYGRGDVGGGKRVLVEFVSANPNGPVHVGHGRGAVLGDVIANLLDAVGYRAEREFYVNDATLSTQMQNFGRSLEARYLELLGREAQMPEDGYLGEYVVDLARQIVGTYGRCFLDMPSDKRVSLFTRMAKEQMGAQQQQTLERFGVCFDHWFSEQSLHEADKVAKAIESLRAAGHLYEQDGAVWLRTTTFGDDKDRPIVRRTGAYTYIAADAAYHINKFERDYDFMVNVWGPDHHGYTTRTKAALYSLGYDADRLHIFIYQIVRLFRGGELVRVSKREGDMITLDELMDEVGVDAARFFFLVRSHDSPLDFDLDLAKEHSEKNPVYYVQYAHARIRSILREAELRGVRWGDNADWSLLTTEPEKELLHKIADLPHEIALAATHYEPHRLTRYAQELATTFHLFYTECRVLGSESDLTQARLALARVAQIALRNTLRLLGVSAPERM